MRIGVWTSLCAQFADQRQAVALGQHSVDDQHVVFALQGQREALLAVSGLVGHVPDLAKSARDVVSGIAVIFDNEDSHGGPVKGCQV